jgi:putative Holliday junction resolvase
MCSVYMVTTNQTETIVAPVLALDLGEKRVGIAVSDALSISITRLAALPRSSWKQTLRAVEDLVRRFDAQTVVIGLPLRLNGSVGDAAIEAQRVAQNFAESLAVPVYLQDERLSSTEAEESLRQEGRSRDQIAGLIDSEAAAVILRDFIEGSQKRIRVSPSKKTH